MFLLNHKYSIAHFKIFNYIDHVFLYHRKRLYTIGFIIGLIGLISLYLFTLGSLCRESANEEASSIAGHVLRFHVVANSDSADDQSLKLELKSWLLEALQPYLINCQDAQSADTWVQEHLPLIQQLSENFLQIKQIEQPIRVSYNTCYFPIKTYGNYTFPPGNYTALQVQIGNAKGHNWWCVLYPKLCFSDETTADFSEESAKILQEDLSYDDYESISNEIPIKWKIAEWFNDLCSADES